MPDDIVPLSKAAAILKVSAQTLRNCANGKRGPGLPTEVERGKACVSIEVARAYLAEHTKASVGKPALKNAPLHPPPPMENQSEQTKWEDGLKEVRSLRQLVERLISEPALLQKVNPEMLRALTQVDAALLRREVAEEKQADRISVDDAVSMLRSLGQIYRDQIHAGGASRLTARLTGWLRRFGWDLGAQNPTALQELENEIREDANTTLTAIAEEVQRQVNGVNGLEGTT